MTKPRNIATQRPDEAPMRLHRLLAAAGIASRRHSEEFIRAGRVTVGGEVVDDVAATVDPHRQEVRLDGELVRLRAKRYYLLNKPPGYVTTHRDPASRPRAIDLLPDSERGLFPVGRLDLNSEGLLLVTNDGELANRLAHPRYRVQRTYRVQVAGRPTRETLDKLKRGLYFPEGKFRAQSVRGLGTKGKSTFVELDLTEGKNREIRRLFARLGHKVMRLERVAFGPLKLGRLPPGRFRPLKPAELKELRRFVEEQSRRLARK